MSHMYQLSCFRHESEFALPCLPICLSLLLPFLTALSSFLHTHCTVTVWPFSLCWPRGASVSRWHVTEGRTHPHGTAHGGGSGGHVFPAGNMTSPTVTSTRHVHPTVSDTATRRRAPHNAQSPVGQARLDRRDRCPLTAVGRKRARQPWRRAVRVSSHQPVRSRSDTPRAASPGPHDPMTQWLTQMMWMTHR